MELTILPISTEAEHRAALALVDSLFAVEPGTRDGDHLDALLAAIEAYEDREHPIAMPDPIDAIRVRMAEKNLRPRDLEPMIGSRGRVSEVLARKRALTLPMIRRLSRGLDLPADVLIQEIRTPPASLAREDRERIARRSGRPDAG
jgi:HTH-type transcriptional regulator/antitoxin HigA